MGHGRKTTVLHFRGIKRHRVIGKLESLLDQRGEFTDASALLAENFLGVCGADDDIGDGGSDADFNARVALFGKLALEKFIEFGVEDTICVTLSDLFMGFRLCSLRKTPQLIRSFFKTLPRISWPIWTETYQRRTFSAWSYVER